MTDDNSNLVDMDLSAFEAEFLKPKADIEIEEKSEDTGDEAPAPDEDEDAAEEADEASTEEAQEDEQPEDEPEPESEDDDEEEDEEEDESKEKGKKRKSFQKRFDDVYRRAKEAERREAALLQRLEALERRDREVSKQEPLKEALPQDAPNPDAVGEDGEPLYPLGRFDEKFIYDLTIFYNEKAWNEKKAEDARQAEAAKIQAQQSELRSQWNEKVEEYEKEHEDIREHMTDLVDTFSTLEPAYGEYLAVTIMQSENGPAIMEYLSQNIGEAQKIVASGPAAATLAIGRLDAKLASVRPAAEDKGNVKKTSSAPKPPETVTKGRKGQAPVRGDTDDLAAFERVFLKK